jgi:hypothetical protein
LRLEQGKTKNPEPAVLRALARLYDMRYEELAGRFVEQRYGIIVGQADAQERVGALDTEPDRELAAGMTSRVDDDAQEDVASPATRLARVIADLTVIAKDIGRQTAVARRGGSRHASRPGRGSRRADRRGPPKSSPE